MPFETPETVRAPAPVTESLPETKQYPVAEVRRIKKAPSKAALKSFTQQLQNPPKSWEIFDTNRGIGENAGHVESIGIFPSREEAERVAGERNRRRGQGWRGPEFVIREVRKLPTFKSAEDYQKKYWPKVPLITRAELPKEKPSNTFASFLQKFTELFQ